MCCSEGKVQLQPIQTPSAELLALYTGTNEESDLFRDNIRSYNTALSFTSFGGTVVQPPNHGPFSFRLHSESYHLMGSMLPDGNAIPQFAQTYFYDSGDAQLQHRVAFARRGRLGIQEALLAKVQAAILRDNPFALQFRQMGLLPNNNQRLIIRERIVDDQRRYNAPTASEIAVLMPDTEFSDRDIILTQTGGGLQRISQLHGAYDPLQYPLLFDKGDYGWFLGLGNNKVTIKQYYAYRLMERDNEPSLLFHGGKLFQQYVVDGFSKMEGARLKWVRANQKTLRADSYNNIQDAIQGVSANGDPVNAAAFGSKFILPATYIGSPRYMSGLYQDAMAIVRHYGFPDLFVTFTCNPNWPEIQRELKPGQTASDRPDLVSRVFHLRLKKLLKDLAKKFPQSARVHSIEFQKRGLPHAHILSIFKRDSKLRTVDAIDEAVCAELPADPILRKIVIKHHTHGPCGVHNPYSPCMKDGVCSKGFPKQFAAETTLSPKGFPNYRRRQGDTFQKTRSGPVLDNRWIVPYNPEFLALYDAHLNFEVATSIKSVKYLYKYIFKGPDMATATVGEPVRDEIAEFLNCRFE
jgi:hypothetical protein